MAKPLDYIITGEDRDTAHVRPSRPGEGGNLKVHFPSHRAFERHLRDNKVIRHMSPSSGIEELHPATAEEADKNQWDPGGSGSYMHGENYMLHRKPSKRGYWE